MRRSITPKRARRPFDASVDPTDARNAGVRLVIPVVGIAKRPHLPLPDRLFQGELVPPQHVDVVDQQG
jgi:hypothetical protein